MRLNSSGDDDAVTPPTRGDNTNEVTLLWHQAARITDDVAEQTFIVVLAIKSGKPPSYLAYRRSVMQGRGHCGLGDHPLGIDTAARP